MTPILDGLKALGPIRLAALGAVGLALLGVLAFLSMHQSTARFALLYSDLDLREAAQIADSLDKQHIPHESAAGGSQILVPGDQVNDARLALARESLPTGGSIGYEIFDRGDGFTESQFQQNINQLRALEGELARTIRGIRGIRAARVHLVLPKREPFARDPQQAQASVMITTPGAGRLDRESVQAIVNLVAAAVPGLHPHDITVVDNRGDLLATAGDTSTPANVVQSTEDLRRKIELRLTGAVEDVLERTLGPGRARAEATVDADFDQVHEQQERYDPDGQVVRSTQTNSDNNRSTEASPNVSVQNNLPNADAGNAASGSQQQRQEETTNYEIGKTVRTVAREQADIKRISMAVLVDGVETQGADGKTTWQPRTPEQLAQIERLVKTTIGFDDKRGDQVEVVNMQFVSEAPEPAAAPSGLLGTPLQKGDLMSLAQTLLTGLVAVIAILLVLRPMVMRLTTLPSDAVAIAGGGTGSALAGGAAMPVGAAGVPMLAGPGGEGPPPEGDVAMLADDSFVSLTNIEGQLRASSIRRLTDMVDRHPEESLSIVRAWMQQEAA